jgi:hypothetical protein
MSSPISAFETMINDFITGAATVLDQLAQALINYAPVIGSILVAVGMGYIFFRQLGRIPFVGRLVGWLTGA